MYFLGFPAEILERIFSYVGPEFFRRNLSQLSISKKWNIFARNKFSRGVVLNDKNLDVLSLYLTSQKIVTGMENRMEMLKLKFRGYYDGRQSEENRPVFCRSAYVIYLNEQLDILAEISHRCRKLHRLRIETDADGYFGLSEDYLDRTMMCEILAIENLTYLDLNLGTGVSPTYVGKNHLHLCASIAARLPTLLELRLRLRRMCPDALKPPATMETSEPTLHLHTIIIFVTSNNEQSVRDSNFEQSVRDCRTPATGELLWAPMQGGLEKLIPQMAKPKVVRLLSHVSTDRHELAGSDRIQGYDLLNEKHFTLDQDAYWSDEGEDIEDGKEGLIWRDDNLDSDLEEYASSEEESCSEEESYEDEED